MLTMLLALLTLPQVLPQTVPSQPLPPSEEAVAPYDQHDANAGATPFKGGAMWRAFHQQAGVDRVIDSFVARNVADRRIADIFRGQDLVRLRRLLKEQFCYILGGGCHYSGRTMTEAHRNMGVQRADVGAVVENLQAAMRQERVPFRAQNRLLAKLAAMTGSMVTR